MSEGIENGAKNVPDIFRHSRHPCRSDVFVKRPGMALQRPEDVPAHKPAAGD